MPNKGETMELSKAMARIIKSRYRPDVIRHELERAYEQGRLDKKQEIEAEMLPVIRHLQTEIAVQCVNADIENIQRGVRKL